MSKNRIKVPALTVRTREEMEILAGNITALKIHVQATTADMDDQIKLARDQFAPRLAALEEGLATAMEAARAWADANPAEFGAARSIDMTHAVIGYRIGQPQLKTLAGWTWDRVLEKLRVCLPHCIRTKEEVDKQTLLSDRDRLGVDGLRNVGVRVVQEETFFVDPKLTEVQTRETVDAK